MKRYYRKFPIKSVASIVQMADHILTDEQKNLIHWFKTGKGNAVCIARAGCFKTYTSILGLNAANEPSMLYAIFNKKNQIEAASKVTNLNVNVSTLHSVGMKIVLSYWRGVMGNSYTEYSRIKTIAPDAPPFVMFQAAKLVSYLKNCFVNPTSKEALDTANLRGIDTGKYENEGWTLLKLIDIVLKSIENSKTYPADRKISFDDMVWLPNVMGWTKKLYDLVCIDECQDMNINQLKMAMDSCKVGGRIVLVGDDKQAIYGFRGAMQNCMEHFTKELKAKQFTLTKTGRCPKKIVGLAQLTVPDIQAMENAIDGEIEMINESKMLETIKVKDVILSRTNAPLMKCCLKLIRNNISAYCEGREVAKMLIKTIEETGATGMDNFLDKLDTWLANKVAKAGSHWYASNALAVAQDTAETLRVLSESVTSLPDMEIKINSLFLDADYVKVPSVVCSTVHRAKGLEWHNVHILNETFNSKRATTPEQRQEETNIYYVAITRCKSKLSLVSPD